MENEKFNAIVAELISNEVEKGLTVDQAILKLAQMTKAAVLESGLYEELRAKGAAQVPAAVKAQAAPANSSRVNLEVTSVELKTKLPVDRNSTIKAIKASLKARGLSYSVTGGRGTTWGWITIDLMPAQFKSPDKAFTVELRRNMQKNFGLSATYSSISIPAGNDYYREYMDRAAGIAPRVIGKPYWD